jgi:hypothetical protein
MGQHIPQVIGRLAMRVIVEALMAEWDHPDAEPMQQLLNMGLIEPDDAALGPGRVEKPLPQRREINLSVHHLVEHVCDVTPLTEPPSQRPLGPAPGARVVLLDPRARAAQTTTSAIDAGQEAFPLASRTGSVVTDCF